MGRVFAVAGKGGVGKSTISSLIVSYLSKKTGRVVLAVDADPNYNLGEKLGIEISTTIGELRDELQKADESGVSKQEKTAYGLRMALAEGERFDLITMGHSEGKGCYCYINSVLRDYLKESMEEYPYIVIDNEAGMEHISRLLCRKMDVLLIVTDATPIGFKTAKRILNTAQSLDIEIGRTVLVVNKTTKEINPEDIPDEFSAAYFIPYDEIISELTEKDCPLNSSIDGKAYCAAAKMIDDILKSK